MALSPSEGMEIKPYILKAKLSFPPGLYESVPIADVVTNDGDHFVAIAGLDKYMATQLKHYSLSEDDLELQENTSDKKRFGEGSYEEWYAKGRTPFALVHKKSGSLAAIVWFGSKPLGRKSMKYFSAVELAEEKKLDAENWHTISYRSYNPFRGKGYMREFARFAIDTYLKVFPEAKLWAIFKTKNNASITLAEKLGFKLCSGISHPEENLAVMVLG